MKESIVATMLFADLISSTEMAKNLTLQEYDEMIVDFQSTMYEVVSHHLSCYDYLGDGLDAYWAIAGDELRLFLYSGAVRFDVRNALLIATKIKLAWLASAFNERILKEGRLVSRIGVGINCGKVIKDLREWRVRMGQEQPNIEGYAINVSKRVESASREANVYQIMVGDSLYKRCQESNEINVTFSQPRSLVFKGLGQKIPVYEVVSFVNFEILPSMPVSLQEGLMEKMQYAVTQPNPEPWIFVTLLRHYISLIASGTHEYIESHGIELAKQALEVMEYKTVIYNMLGWLYGYGQSVRNLEMALHYFDHSLSLEPRNEPALLHKARILDAMGKTDLARHAYEQILFHNNDHAEARRKVGHNQAGQQ
jgi:class 3 adenylate cyclase